MEEKAIELFTRFTNVTVLYRTSDGEYFIELADMQRYILRSSEALTYALVNRIDPLPSLPSPWTEPPVVWGQVNNPLAYNAVPLTNPANYPHILIYNVSTVGTYTNFRDSSNNALVVTAGDLGNGLVQFRWEGGWKKVVVAVPMNGAVAEGDVKGVSGDAVFKSEANLWTAAKLFFSSNTSPHIESGVLNFGVCYVFSFGPVYLRLNAGSVDLNPYFSAESANDRFAICCTGLGNLFSRSGGVIVKNASDLSVVRFSETGVIGDKNTLILFTYDRATGKIKGNFQEQIPNNTFAVSPTTAFGSAENDIVLNTYDKLFFSTNNGPVIEGNIIKWTSDLYIFNGTLGYIRISAGQLDLSSYITNTGNDRFFIYINVENFLKRTTSGATVINSSGLLVSIFTNGEAFSKGKIIVFLYDKIANLLITPFDTSNKSSKIGFSLPKFQYGVREELSFNKANKTVSWAQRIYIFSRARGTTASQYLYIEPKVISFAEKVAEFPSDIWFTCYAEAPESFISGTQNGSAILPVASIKIRSWSEDQTIIRSQNTLVLFNYNALLNTIESPFLEQFAQTKALDAISAASQAKASWFNKYPGTSERLKIFFQKYMFSTNDTAENRTRIISVGDSLLARHQHTSALNVVPAENPPTLITKNIMAYLWENLKGIKPLYRRYDSGFFTETGAFELVETNAGWDDSGDIYSAVKSSAENNASISFIVGVDHDYFNFIDRRHRVSPSTAISIAVSGGNGVLEYKLEGGVWTEANGATFSQEMPSPNASLGIGNTQFQRRIMFRKVGSGAGTSFNVTLQNTISSTNFYYWGLELIPNGKRYVQLINVARGGHSFQQLKSYVQTDVIDRTPDLVVLEIPLLNMVNESTDLQVNVDRFVDFVWGDRAGFENPRSLKNASDNWQNFQVLLIVPHHSRVHYTSGSSFLVNPDGYTAESIYNAIKGEIFRRGDLSFVDISTAMISDINADSLYTGDYYSALRSSGVAGDGYMNDSLHQNNKGTEVWAKELCPIFWGNTL